MKQLEEYNLTINKEQKIKEKASQILDVYEEQLDPRVYELAKNEINKEEKKETPKIEESKEKEAAPKKKIIRRRKIED